MPLKNLLTSARRIIKTLVANVESFQMKLQHQKRGVSQTVTSDFFVEFC